MWEKLTEILSELLELYQTLLSLSQQKREVLVSGKAQNLESVTRQEELLILQVGKLDSMRSKLIGEIAAAHHLPAQEVTLSRIREMTDNGTASKLAEIESKFHQVTTELASLNKLNTQLIEQALHFVNYNINILAQTQTGPTYAPKGNSGQPQQPTRALFDAKA